MLLYMTNYYCLTLINFLILLVCFLLFSHCCFDIFLDFLLLSSVFLEKFFKSTPCLLELRIKHNLIFLAYFLFMIRNLLSL